MQRIITFIVAAIAALDICGTAAGTEYISPQNLKNQNKMEKLLRQSLEQMAQGNYEKAQRCLTEFAAKTNAMVYGADGVDNVTTVRPGNPYVRALSPLWQVAEAWLNNRPSGSNISTAPDRWRAQELIAQAMRSSSRSWANGILAHKKIGTSVEQLARQIDVAVLSLAQAERTEQAYGRFLARATTPVLIEQAKREQEGVAYDRAKRSSSIKACEHYLTAYSGICAEHYRDIEQLAGQYAFEQLDYTVESCRQFLAAHPNAKQAAAVRERLYSLAFNELDSTSASCRQYLHDYPSSPYVAEVQSLLYRYAFQEMPSTADGYTGYLAAYPLSPYCQQLRDKLLKMAYDNAIAVGTVEAYDQFLAQFGNSGYAIEIARRRKDMLSTPEDFNAELKAIEARNRSQEPATGPDEITDAPLDFDK